MQRRQRTRTRWRRTLGVMCAALALGACEPEAPKDSAHPEGPARTAADEGVAVVFEGDGDHSAWRLLDGRAEVEAALAGGPLTLRSEDGGPFLRAGLRFDTAGGRDPGLMYRVRRGEAWGAWRALTPGWHEGVAFNAHLELEAPADELALRVSDAAPEAALTFAFIELYADALVREAAPAPRVEPARPDGGLGVLEQALAPPSYVIPRAEWGATDPDKVCGALHTPRYLTVHHTAGPTFDAMSPEARLRQIQDFHINTRGWCDIGYHFLVSNDGRLWQGRSTHERPGAHVGGHNTDNVGISFMGSFHIDPVPDAMIEGTAPLFGWLRDNYAIPLERGVRVFGHREWEGQSTTCPGDFLLPRVQEIIDLAEGVGGDDAVTVEAAWFTVPGQARDLVAEGSSGQVFDALVGQQVEGAIVVRSGAERPATDDVILGYWIETPYLTPIRYRIETDRPALDGQTFVASDQNGRADNPAADAPPAEGFVRVGSVAPGETVRVVFTLEASEYSIGLVDHPDLRGWVKHIADHYGEQDGWDDPVETNLAGGLLRDVAQLDIFSPRQWHFDGADGADLEGWQGDADVDTLAVNLNDGAMAIRAGGVDPQTSSPPWTSIDAGVYDQLVLRARQHGGPRQAQLFWAGAGEDFSEARSVSFETPGDGAFVVHTLDVGQAAGWSGQIARLRLDPWDGGPFEGAPAWFDVDYLMAVDATNPPVDDDGDGAPAEVDCDDANVDVRPGGVEVCDGLDNDCDDATDEDGVCDPAPEDIAEPPEDVTPGPDVSPGPDVDGADTGADVMADADVFDDEISRTDAEVGCCATVTAPRSTPRAPLIIALVFAAVAWTRRRP